MTLHYTTGHDTTRSDDLTPEQAGLAYLTGTTFTDEAFFHAAAQKLREEDPVHWVEHDDFNPFYVLTKHADVLEVELHQNQFLNAPRAILGTKESDAMRAMQGHLVKSLVQMDDPEHRSHRNLTSDWFLPKNLGKPELIRSTFVSGLKRLPIRYRLS